MKKKWFIIVLCIILCASALIFVSQKKEEKALNTLSPVQETISLTEESTETDKEENTTKQDTNEDGKTEENNVHESIVTMIQHTVGEVFNQEVNIVAIGDSLTFGVGDSTKNGGYVGILDRSINKDQTIANIENLGVPGNRTDHLLKRLGKKEVKESIREADLVLITIGANDIMKVAKENITNLELEDFINERNFYEDRLKESLQIIREMNPETEIYLLGIYNPFENYFGDIPELSMIVEAWNNTSKTVTSEVENITFIPIIDLFSNNSENLFAEDNFHPNYRGYYLMFERVLEYISNEEG